MYLQLVLEAVTGTPLDQLLQDQLTSPLGMKDTFFNRGNKALSEKLMNRVAATEYQIETVGPMEPQRPQPVWGNVCVFIAAIVDGSQPAIITL
jgi:CubicO group peptidase (beta-lactamase class C family)